MTIRVGLVNQSAVVTAGDVQALAAALDTQVKRDLKLVWGVEADVVAAPGRVAPAGVWPIFINDHPPGGFAGVHTLRPEDKLPWAIVSTTRNWRLAASHELIEMLVDPSGERTVWSRGLALDGQDVVELDTQYEYLLEACDPIEDEQHAYDIDGVLVSDFYTPYYFDPAFTEGRAYSFAETLKRPREITPGGYLSWRHPVTKKLQQLRRFGDYTLVDLPEQAAGLTLREHVDAHTRTPRLHPKRHQ